MTDKEKIIINGEKYNACNGCKLWDGYICTGDRSYEPNAEAHRAICNEHMAHEFWKVYHELFYKTQECEELKKKFSKFFNIDNQECWDIAFLKDENARYRKALEEIWGLTQSILDDFETYDTEMQLSYCHDISYHILDIINKAVRKRMKDELI